MDNKYGKWTGWLHEFLHIFSLSLFYSRCRNCGNDLVYRHERVICEDCERTIEMNSQPNCSVCSRPMDQWHHLCGECLVHPPAFRKHVSFSIYDGLIRELILAYKYGGIEPLKFLFSKHYFQLFEEQVAESFDYIIPVPPDKGRKREFHPIHEVAKLLSKQLNIPFLGKCLVKVKKTQPQAGLSRAKRLVNLNGAFSIRQPDRVEHKKILLIDDIYTTGTTIKKCTELLVSLHADVVAMTLARSL